jgi:hypothetical protein
VDAGKLALLGLAITVFFLFTGTYYFPGGAHQFLAYADAVLYGHKLPSEVAQRDVGYPLLLLLGGYPGWESILGITLIQAAFAIMMPILIYWSLLAASPTIAFYAGALSAVSFAPIYFLKWIHHDQTYIFFVVLVTVMLAVFLQSREYRFLYFFTLAAIGASVSRPAGNLLFPLLVIVAYVTVRGRIAHYLSCVMIFVTVAGLYQWHRYEIFDMRHQASIPSYTGQQIFYNLYVNSAEFGVRLTPDLGPALRSITESLRSSLQPNVREAPYMQTLIAQYPPDFANNHILPYTPDQLIDEIFERPNYEYYNLLASADPDDQSYLRASWEIVQAHPLYVLQYSLRNMLKYLFDPGYSHTRNNVHSYHKIELQFLPSGGAVYDSDKVSKRAASEMQYNSLSETPRMVQKAFSGIVDFWLLHFDLFVFATSVLMIIAWIGVLLRVFCAIMPQTKLCQCFMFPAINGIVAGIVTASMFLLYNAAVTSAFAEPDYRYFHFSELLRILISGFAIILLTGVLLNDCHAVGRLMRSSAPYQGASQVIAAIQSHDVVAGYFGIHRKQQLVLLLALTAVLLAWWTVFMIFHTW